MGIQANKRDEKDLARIRESLVRVESLVNDEAYQQRMEVLADLSAALGGESAARGIIEVGKRVRTQLRVACLGLRKALDAGDEAGIEINHHNLLEVMAQEAALSLELSKAVSDALFLLPEGSDPKLYVWHLEAPAYLQSMVKMLKSEVKAETGRATQDWEALVGAVLFSLTRIDEFRRSAVVVGPAHAFSSTASAQRG